jgi:hypothetical protein
MLPDPDDRTRVPPGGMQESVSGCSHVGGAFSPLSGEPEGRPNFGVSCCSSPAASLPPPCRYRARRSRRVLTAAPDRTRDGVKRVRRCQANIAAGYGARSRQRLGNNHRIRIGDLSLLGRSTQTCFRRSSRNNRLLAKTGFHFSEPCPISEFRLS